MKKMINIIGFEHLTIKDVDRVGGKNASLGEMIQHLSQLNVQVPGGFATTAEAYRKFLAQNDLDQKIYQLLAKLDIKDVKSLKKTGKKIRNWIIKTPFLADFEQDVKQALSRFDLSHQSLAIRSSATAEDLPTASFAGQQETYLNINGLSNVLRAIKKVFASLYTDRAIGYRVAHGFDHDKVALSAGIQLMVRSDKASSGVIFTLDTESGFDQVVLITAAYGLGETVVQGIVNPDEFTLYKPNLADNRPAILRRKLGSKEIKMIYSTGNMGAWRAMSTTKTVGTAKKEQNQFSLTDAEIQQLGLMAVKIEQHYKRPMDIEWAKDGITGELYIVQARPETVKSQEKTKHQVLENYHLQETGPVLVEGLSIGERIASGKVCLLNNISEMDLLKPGDVLVTEKTDPDWEPIMRRASAIVTDKGGRTCHAAIVARELGIPAIVGCNDATEKLQTEQKVTVSCSEGSKGFVYEGLLKFEVEKTTLDTLPKLPLKLMMNVGNPDQAFHFQSLPNEGVGLARIEFIISNQIGVHPKAILNFKNLPSKLKAKIKDLSLPVVSDTTGNDKKLEAHYIEKLKEGIATIAAAFYPKPVIVRTSDFKSNEYSNLLGGDLYEPHEENPMIGFRGASRYVSEDFEDCFALECEALKQVREEMGLTNVEVMIPFVRTVKEGKAVIDLLEKYGLKRGENGLKVIMMCEIPSNAILADEFLDYFDGFSIGSNDLTQLTLGLDRDSDLIAKSFDERNDAVKFLIERAIETCLKRKKYIGICGQAPSDYPDFAKWLKQLKIESISLNPDSVIRTWLELSK